MGNANLSFYFTNFLIKLLIQKYIIKKGSINEKVFNYPYIAYNFF